MCSALYCSPQADGAGEDWQLSQAEVYWPACWWLGLHTITDTEPLFPASRTPQLRVDTLCFTASLDVNSLPPLIMCEEGKSSLSGRSGPQVALFEVVRIQQLPLSYRPGFVLFYSIQICTDTRFSRCTVWDKKRLLHLSLVTLMHPCTFSVYFILYRHNRKCRRLKITTVDQRWSLRCVF